MRISDWSSDVCSSDLAAEIRTIAAQGKIAAVIGVEGGHMIEARMDYLDGLFARGARYLTLTWNNSTEWATSATDERRNPAKLKHKGLTDFGRQVISRMNALGMMVELSQVGRPTLLDTMKNKNRRVIRT